MAASLAVSACLSEPAFFTLGDAPAARDPAPADDGRSAPVSVEEPMVHLATTTLDVTSDVQPNGKDAAPAGNGEKPDKGNQGKGKGNDKGNNGKGDEDAGGGGNDPAPTPTPSTAPPPASSPRVVPAFWVDAFEVGAASYAACVAAGACPTLSGDVGCTVAAGLSDHPATCVPFDAAGAYCAFRGKRLLRDDEWLALTTGASGRAYPWGDDAPSAERVDACGPECNPGAAMYAASDGFAATAPRGQYPAGRSPEGVYDLAGNAREWVTSDALGPTVRGGAYDDVDPSALRARSFVRLDPATVSPTVGFRCARDD